MPAYKNYDRDKGYDAAAALTVFRFCKFSAEETVTPVTAKTDAVAGVAQFGVTAGELLRGKGASVAQEGISEVEVSATVVVGTLAGLNADGTVHTAASGDRVVGEFTKGAVGAGSRAACALSLPGYILP